MANASGMMADMAVRGFPFGVIGPIDATRSDWGCHARATISGPGFLCEENEEGCLGKCPGMSFALPTGLGGHFPKQPSSFPTRSLSVILTDKAPGPRRFSRFESP